MAGAPTVAAYTAWRGGSPSVRARPEGAEPGAAQVFSDVGVVLVRRSLSAPRASFAKRSRSPGAPPGGSRS